MWKIYFVWMNHLTKNFGGLEWVVEGENGTCTYPGTWTEETVREYYRNGWIYSEK